MQIIPLANLSTESRKGFEKAIQIAEEYRHTTLMCLHLLLALIQLELGNAPVILGILLGSNKALGTRKTEMDIRIKLRKLSSLENQKRASDFGITISGRQIPITLPLLRALEYAREKADQERVALGTDYLLYGIARADSKAKVLLAGEGFDEHRISDAIAKIGATEEKAMNESLIDLSVLAQAGELPLYYLRKRLLQKVTQVLLRKRHNSLLLVGEFGAGSRTLFRSWVAQAVGSVQVLEIRQAALISNPGQTIRAALEIATQRNERIILFIPQIQTIWDEKGLLPELQVAIANAQIQCVGTITRTAHNLIGRDPILNAFGVVYVEPTDKGETLAILQLHVDRLAKEHEVTITPESLPVAVELAGYMGKATPWSAILLLSTVCTTVRSVELLGADLRPENMLPDRKVDPSDVVAVVAQVAEVPLSGMPITPTEQTMLLQMEKRLHRRIIGQDEAINAVADTYRRARAGLRDPKRPIGSFIFLGPTGVGKTELAKALAEFLFGSDESEHFTRIDMSEYTEKHTVLRLIGAPPSYVGYEEGGQLTETVRNHPYQVILFDEIEKAHPKVWDVLLQVLEDGRLTDGQGHVVDFTNCVIIMTSNIGTEFIPAIFRNAKHRKQVQNAIDQRLRQTFRPEFLNRIDNITYFRHLTKPQLMKILEIQLGFATTRIKQTWQVNVVASSDAVKQWLLDQRKGEELAFGARPLKRVIQRCVESPLAKELIAGKYEPGDTIEARVERGRVKFVKTVDNSA